MKTEELVIKMDVVSIEDQEATMVSVDGKKYGGVKVSLKDNDPVSYLAGHAVELGLTEDSTHAVVEGETIVKFIKVDK